jgi:hypothetical protein
MSDLERRARGALESIGLVRPRRSPVWPMVVLGLLVAGIGALVAYAFDPQLGRTRRAMTRERVAGASRRVGRSAARRGRWIRSTAVGVGRRIEHAATTSPSPKDEVALAARVKSELFRDPTIDKGAIAVNVERDVLFLRGTAPTRAEIDRIAHEASRIDGVARVVNLVHVPGEPAPVMDAGAERTTTATETGTREAVTH